MPLSNRPAHPPRALLVLLLLLMTACAPATMAGGSARRGAAPDYRLYESGTASAIDLDALATVLQATDIIFFGEFHDDPITHRVQAELLNTISPGREVVLGLEMFERDVQPMLDHYLRGDIPESAFLERARPWPNYATDYRPLVELARERGWKVLATNIPQTIAGAIARDGLVTLDSLDHEERRMAAEAIECPADEYWERFLEAVTGGDDEVAHTLQSGLTNLYFAQCARDETMAETIAQHIAAGALVVHINGGFHSDFSLGIVPRLLRRVPGARIRSITALPVENPARAEVEEYLGRADYLLFTREP